MTELSTAPAASQTRAPGTKSSANSIRRRLVRHYVPLVLASAAGLALFMNVGTFDANRYPPPGDVFTEGVSGAFPDGDYPPPNRSDPGHERTGTSPSQDTGTQTPTTGQAGHTGPPAGGHGGSAAPDPSGPPDSGADVAPAGDTHAGDQESVLRMRRYSTATGYVAFVLLAVTLLIGPANLVLRRRNPVSSYFRRDVGIWTAIASVIHVVFGFLVKHGDGQLLGYFFEPGDRSRALTNSFGLANWAGLAAVVIVAGLTVISSDAALRTLKARRWKRLQRLNYLLFGLVIAHSVFYGALWRKTSPYTVALALVVIAVGIAQAVGVRRWRQRATRTATT